MARDPLLDITFNCNSYDSEGNYGMGIALGYAVGEGDGGLNNYTTSAIGYAVASATPIFGNVLLNVSAAIAYAIGGGEVYLIPKRNSFVKWSKIGQIDFTIDKTNESGERPVDWSGFVWDVKKLGNKVVAYGQNGVTLLTPIGVNVGMETISRIGLKGKNAVAGTDKLHFFVDNLGQLWRLSDSLKMLDYSEFLASTTANLSLFYDNANDLLYLCDGVIGFLYCDGSQSFGKGPINVTGINSKSGVLYVTSNTAIVTPIFEICTDIYDFGTRRGKSIVSIEFGTDVATALKTSIDYRLDKAEAFKQTPWYTVDSRGIYYISLYGKEFRFRLKSEVWEYFELDYINVNYRVHDH